MNVTTSSTAPCSSLGVTEETALFSRLCHLLINGATEILKTELDNIHPPSTLPGVLQIERSNLRRLPRGVMNPSMWNQLYPTPISYGCSSDFDITLLFVLIRNICGLNPPSSTKSWDKDPPVTDQSLEADLVRLKLFRNKLFAHITHTAINKKEFKTLWTSVSNVLIRRGGGRWKTVIDNLLADPFTQEEKDYVLKLKEWHDHELDVKNEIQKLQSSTTEIGDRMSKMTDSLICYNLNATTEYQELKSAVIKLHCELFNLKALINCQDLDVKTTIQSLEDGFSTLNKNFFKIADSIKALEQEKNAEPPCKRSKTGKTSSNYLQYY